MGVIFTLMVKRTQKMRNYNKQIEGLQSVELLKCLQAYAKALTGNYNDANDLVQETYLRMLVNADKYTNEGKLQAWACVVMKRQFYNDIKKQGNNTLSISDREYIIEHEEHVTACEPECCYYKKEIIRVINSMPAREAHMLNMRMEGYKYEEIGEAFSMPMGTVRSKLFYAKSKLQKRLSGYDEYNIN